MIIFIEALSMAPVDCQFVSIRTEIHFTFWNGSTTCFTWNLQARRSRSSACSAWWPLDEFNHAAFGEIDRRLGDYPNDFRIFQTHQGIYPNLIDFKFLILIDTKRWFKPERTWFSMGFRLAHDVFPMTRTRAVELSLISCDIEASKRLTTKKLTLWSR